MTSGFSMICASSGFPSGWNCPDAEDDDSNDGGFTRGSDTAIGYALVFGDTLCSSTTMAIFISR